MIVILLARTADRRKVAVMAVEQDMITYRVWVGDHSVAWCMEHGPESFGVIADKHRLEIPEPWVPENWRILASNCDG